MDLKGCRAALVSYVLLCGCLNLATEFGFSLTAGSPYCLCDAPERERGRCLPSSW